MKINLPLDGLTEDQKKELLPENLILLGYRGSIAHGMFVPSTDPDSIDDRDLMGVYVGPVQHYLGFGRNDVKEKFIGRWDSVCYELRKFIGLLLKGNPNVLTMLWLPDKFVLLTSDVAEDLRAHKELFRSRKVFNAFTGYAHGQLKRMTHLNGDALHLIRDCENILVEHGLDPNDIRADQAMRDKWVNPAIKLENVIQRYDGLRKKYYSGGYMGAKRRELVERFGYDTKNAAHLIRLLRMGIEFLETGDLEVERHDAEELLRIKRGEFSLAQITEDAERLFEQSKRAYDNSKLPDEPQTAAAEELCLHIISEFFGF